MSEIGAHRLHGFGVAHEHHAWRALAADVERPAEMPVGHQSHRTRDEEGGEIEAWHEVTVEGEEGHAVGADGDGHGDGDPGEPGSLAEPWLTLVQAGEVTHHQVDGCGHAEAEPVVRERIGGPVGTESDEVDDDHERVEHHGVEDEQNAEAAAP